MFHRLILTTSLILTATFQAVRAESIDVQFSGTVPTQVTVNTLSIGATDKNNSKTPNSITFAVNSNISTNITVTTTSTPSGADTLTATKNSRLALAKRHPTTTSNNYIAPAGTTNLEAPVQQQSSHSESDKIILLTITP